jgi:hypothetical protein
MHRSRTSAFTGALGHLGIAVPPNRPIRALRTLRGDSRQASQARVSVKQLKTVRDYYDSVDRPLGLGRRPPTALFRTRFTETAQCSDVQVVPAGSRPCSGDAVPGVRNRLIESNAALRNRLLRSCEPIRT